MSTAENPLRDLNWAVQAQKTLEPERKRADPPKTRQSKGYKDQETIISSETEG